MAGAAAWFPWVLGIRVLNALVVRTYFTPDEYWQGPEVAHHAVFGFGHLTWEWQSEAQIRGFAHPALYAVCFWVLQVLHIDSPTSCWIAPRLLHAVLTAMQDVSVLHLAGRVFGPNSKAALAAFVLHMTSWFVAYCSVRTYSNSVEAALSTIALALWEWPNPVSPVRSPRWISVVMAALAILMRPTAALSWFPVGVATFWLHKHKSSWLMHTICVAMAVVTSGALLDRWWYGSWVCTPCNFVQHNLLRGTSSLYGVNTPHYYITEGLPVVLTTTLPLALTGVWQQQATQWCRLLLLFIASSLAGYSLSPHKEYRFVLPLVPPMCVLGGAGVSFLWAKARAIKWRKWLRLYFVIAGTLNLALWLYLSLWHQRGPVAVLEHLAEMSQHAPPETISIHFWTPCHATPYYSMLHRDVSLHQLDCSPANSTSPLGDESSRFRANPLAFLRQQYKPQTETTPAMPLPSHAVVFSSVLPSISTFVSEHQFSECGRFFNAHFRGDRDNPDAPGWVVLLCRASAVPVAEGASR